MLDYQRPTLISMADASYYAGVSWETIRRWVKLGYLPVAARDPRGRPLFERLDVARAEKARRDTGVSVPQRITHKRGIAA